MNNTNNIRALVISLTHEKRTELKYAMNDAGLMNESRKKGSNSAVKDFFRAKRDSSSGKLKKIYAALAKANSADLDASFGLLVENFNKV